ncbi:MULTISPECIES: hypothetical protein [Porcipelethomonas]|uniref:hypothetical protein n=1 Tax=Porcipelethomonas TaxID=2981643 RepID=UPI0008216987|nr:hypothetical protein [Porcipelethomonas ammoniilytica]MCU6720842.1 hypothetical protein [Porcipelethomonas ammoniilytica]SCJ27467.1 Uncharacterised protein [uncultured Ruminococcus sp.]
MNNSLKSGQLISEQRHKLSAESQELAKELGISNAYLNKMILFSYLRSAISRTETFYTHTKFNK